jgi:hypothetical protein
MHGNEFWCRCLYVRMRAQLGIHLKHTFLIPVLPKNKQLFANIDF